MNTGCQRCAFTGVFARTKVNGKDTDIPCPECTDEAREARADKGARHLVLTNEKGEPRDLCDAFADQIIGVPLEPTKHDDGTCRWCHAYVDHITTAYKTWTKEKA